MNPYVSAECLNGMHPLPDATDQYDSAGNYEPLPYLLPALVSRAAHFSPANLVRSMRTARALVCIALLVAAAAALHLGGARTPAVHGPDRRHDADGRFLASSLNPSGVEILAAIAFLATLLRLGWTEAASRWVGGARRQRVRTGDVADRPLRCGSFEHRDLPRVVRLAARVPPRPARSQGCDCGHRRRRRRDRPQPRLGRALWAKAHLRPDTAIHESGGKWPATAPERPACSRSASSTISSSASRRWRTRPRMRASRPSAPSPS